MKFKSTIFAQTSGSLAGTTFARNRGGLYVRARSMPVNPATPAQVAVRGFMTILTTAWVNTLTSVQREAWDNYASLVLLPDSLGEPRNVGGLGMYVRSNVPRLQAGLARVDTGPTTYSLPTFTDPVITSITAPTALSLTFTDTDAWANEIGGALLVYVSRGQNQSRNFFKGPYRFADLVAGAVVPPTSPAAIVTPFTLVAGQKAFVQARVCLADGRLSGTFRGVTVVV